MDNSGDLKALLRAELLSARRVLSQPARQQADRAIVAAATSLLSQEMTVAAYDPLGTEPGGHALADALRAHCAHLFLPISQDQGHLSWAEYAGREQMAPGAFGIEEPTGPRLGNEVLGTCDVIFVPALAVSPAGQRLGKGAGYYDRALAALPPAESGARPPVVAIVYESEVRKQVPVQPHDEPVSAILTEDGLRRTDQHRAGV